MFESLQQDSTAPQFELITYVTMTTYWVRDLPNIKGISGHLWHSIFIFADDASYTWSNKHISMLAWVCDLVLLFFELWMGSGKEWVAMGTKNFYSHRCVFYRTISRPSFNSSIYILDVMLGWVYDIVISFAYFTHFSNLYIFGTNAGICKW